MLKASELEAWLKWSFRGGNDWTDWLPFVEGNIDNAPETPGAYSLALPDGREIGRLLRSDPHGVLNVGEAGNLNSRLWQLYSGVNEPGTEGHMAAWRLASTGLLTKLGIPTSALRIAWVEAESKEEAYRKEGAMLDMYFQLFGELPPLNYKANWSNAS